MRLSKRDARGPQEYTRRIMLALLPAVAASRVLAQSVWYAVRGADHSFIVDMPGEPVYKLIDTASPGGTRFVYHSYSLDYRRLAFVAPTAEKKNLLWVRPLNGLVAQPLAGTDGARYPFWSPDGRFLGFFAGGKLKKIDASGGPAQILCDTQEGRGGTWNRDGVILFSPSSRDAIQRVSSAGGAPAPATEIDASKREFSHRFPFFLPDGRHFLYLAQAAGTTS